MKEPIEDNKELLKEKVRSAIKHLDENPDSSLLELMNENELKESLKMLVKSLMLIDISKNVGLPFS